MTSRTYALLGASLALIGAGLGLAGCAAPGEGSFGGYTPPGAPMPLIPGSSATLGNTPNAPPGRVALLAPLTGAYAERGADLQKAAELALTVPGAPSLTVKDTLSTPEGAAAAARAAIAEGDTLIIGPLTNTETAAVAPIARQAGVPVLAFTSDAAQAQPGVWVLGLTPSQQVERLVGLAQSEGKTRLAALLPQNETGTAMGAALSEAAAKAALPPPQERTYGADMASLDAAMRDISAYADRRGPLDAQLREAKKTGDKAAIKAARDQANQPIPPPPFDALLLADTGTALSELATLVPYYDVQTAQIMGPALWASPAARTGAGGVLEGAWYAAPDPAAGNAFATSFAAKYAVQPSALAYLAFDAASIARFTGAPAGGSLTDLLTRPAGFGGADGALRLDANGHVERALAVFTLSHGAPSIASPAPATVTPPSS